MDEPTMRIQGSHDPGRRVLVVDDNKDTARMMKLLLKAEGYEARTAFDGPEAVEAARSFRPDAVLLDLSLPTMSGLEVALEIRSTEGLNGCLIVAVSGYGVDCLPVPSPFDHHLMKPLNHDVLMALLARMVAGGGTTGVPRPSRVPAAIPA